MRHSLQICTIRRQSTHPITDTNTGPASENRILSKTGSLSTAGTWNYHHGEAAFSSKHPKIISSMALKTVYRSYKHITYINTSHGGGTLCEYPGINSSASQLLSKLHILISATSTKPAGRAFSCVPAWCHWHLVSGLTHFYKVESVSESHPHDPAEENHWPAPDKPWRPPAAPGQDVAHPLPPATVPCTEEALAAQEWALGESWALEIGESKIKWFFRHI